MSKVQSASSDDFTGLRGFLWPIHNSELKKFLPMGFLMMCILFNYNILRDTKDTLMVNAPGAGSESLSYLKLYGVTPSAILFIALFFKLANSLEREKLFYVVAVPFISFFTLYGFVIYPNIDSLHLSLSSIKALQAEWPRLHWFIPVIGNWTFSLFYILSELWGSIFVSMLFWQLANLITKTQEAKRFYGLFGMIGNLGLILAGSLIETAADQTQAASAVVTTPVVAAASAAGEAAVATAATATAAVVDSATGAVVAEVVEPVLAVIPDTFGINLKYLMSYVTIAGILMLLTYRWINTKVMTDRNLYDPEQVAQKKQKQKMGIVESFKYIMTNPYLLMIAVIVMAYGISINLVEGVWKGQIKIAFPDKNDYSRFMGGFTKWTGMITILIMLVCNNLLRKLSWLTCAMITPVLVLATSCIFFVFVWQGSTNDPNALVWGTTTAVMAAVLVGLVQNISSKGTKYALFDATKQMAYMPLDNESKTKGQAAVEVIGGRAGKSGGAFIQSTLTSAIGGSVALSSLVHILGPIVIVTCLAWIIAVFKINSGRNTILAAKAATNNGPAA